METRLAQIAHSILESLRSVVDGKSEAVIAKFNEVERLIQGVYAALSKRVLIFAM